MILPLKKEKNNVDEAEEVSVDAIMSMAKKKFEKTKIKKDDERFSYLSDKISSYKNKDIGFTIAIKMAVKLSSVLIDDEFEKVVNEHNEEEEGEEEEGGEEEGGEEEEEDRQVMKIWTFHQIMKLNRKPEYFRRLNYLVSLLVMTLLSRRVASSA